MYLVEVAYDDWSLGNTVKYVHTGKEGISTSDPSH